MPSAITIFDAFDVCFRLHIWIQNEMKIKGCQFVHNLTLILASKSFTLLGLSGKLSTFTLATLMSLHYNIYKNKLKLATFKLAT